MKKIVGALLMGIFSLSATAQEAIPAPKDSRFDKIIKYAYTFPGTQELQLEGISYSIQWTIPDDLITKTTKDAETAQTEQRADGWRLGFSWNCGGPINPRVVLHCGDTQETDK